ncbi:sugar transferase [Devosia submarina]|uniref:sugar transferase n=1 Tax=Devosia submarina TaxID=1173082 RepID=UPI000D379E0B|nr:sugar transferase [Devosia submarina]
MDLSVQVQKSVSTPGDLHGDALRRNLFAAAKRALDVSISLALLIFFLPLITLLVLMIRLDRHPAFYCQTRLGVGGREFRLWKLRSMVADADRCLEMHLRDPVAREEWDRTQKLVRDPRITPVGRFIRKYSIDELPQLWNVLRGDMSLVGPRPMLPEQRALYPGDACFRVRPGITGLWQVSERNASSFAERASYDEYYAVNLSLRLELSIIFKTMWVVLRGTGC